MKNNFEVIDEDLIAQFGEPPQKVKTNIDESFSLFRMIGNVLELFVPRLMEMLVSLAGGNSTNEPDKQP